MCATGVSPVALVASRYWRRRRKTPIAIAAIATTAMPAMTATFVESPVLGVLVRATEVVVVERLGVVVVGGV